ncbi:Protein FAM217B [Galemys pyrenaicus]|uniref:Protein FAM217B n=1 Tax=Galemys pyrenaicus TaxID=202257 RepID=A0A8J6A6W0_GALPY|nr:Protein FAM217B [Galemys pyrenaicus]
MKIIQEPEEDSGSDLSDSERVPIPPSPLSPPELNLRAEEIDPICFDLHAGPGQAQRQPEQRYPDFLPPPFSSWDLRDMALLLNAEGQGGGLPRAAGPLGGLVDRLLQLEWLQLQTVQWEKGRAAKARPPTAPGTSVALKSPGRSRLLAGALTRPHQDRAPKAGPARRDRPQEGCAPCSASEAAPRLAGVPSSSRLSAPRSTLEGRAEEKRKKPGQGTRQQQWARSSGEGGLRLESNGNIRGPGPPSRPPSSPDAGEAPPTRTQALASLKKKGQASSCGHAAALSGKKKLKTNGAQQSTYKPS